MSKFLYLRFPHSRTCFTCSAFFLTSALLLVPPGSAQTPTGLNQATVSCYFEYPATDSSALVGFDWDSEGMLHYTVGDPNWGLKLEVYKHAATSDLLIYHSDAVWAGSRLCSIGDFIYFNDGGDYMRSDFNYLFYPAATAEAVLPLLSAPYNASLWGLTTRHGQGFFASGSEMTWGPAVLFWSALDASGNLSNSLIKFGDIGESPGPMAFDPDGNLYYAPGYVFGSEPPTIFRWTAAEVNAALANPNEYGLLASGHSWAELPPPYTGATGMTTDAKGNVFVTATAWGSPSRLAVYRSVDAATVSVAESDGRLETVRYRDNAVYVSCANGVFQIPLLQISSPETDTEVYAVPEETVLLSVQITGGIGNKRYQWNRLDSNKSMMPVGEDSEHYAFSADLDEGNSTFLCLVSDDLGTLESHQFHVMVAMPTPASNIVVLAVLFVLLPALGTALLCPWRYSCYSGRNAKLEKQH